MAKVKGLLKNLRAPFRNQRGVALLIAIFSLMMMVFVANEVSYDATIEYLVASQQVNRLKAYYAAKAGVEISLLRLLVYKKVLAALGDTLQGNTAMLDPIWQYPFSWPPTLPVDSNSSDKDKIASSVKESWMDASFSATIASEGNKIDVNDLSAFMPDGKGIRDATKTQLLKIFANQMELDEKFRKKYGGTNFEEVVNNMIDWVDEDNESLNGGDEKRYYPDIRSDFIPPNLPFKSIDELHMVAGMKEDFFKLLKNRITIYGTKGINVNYASGDVIKSLDIRITDEVIKNLMKRRNSQQEGGPFKDENDFYGFLDGQGVRIDRNSTKIPLFFGPEFNFRINSTGVYANSKRDITAIVFDYDNVRERYVDWMNKTQQQGSTTTTTPTPAASGGASSIKMQAPKGRPTIVFWLEN